eukprot:scaffold116_cov334-Pavlova_lutheri.AAC.48
MCALEEPYGCTVALRWPSTLFMGVRYIRWKRERRRGQRNYKLAKVEETCAYVVCWANHPIKNVLLLYHGAWQHGLSHPGFLDVAYSQYLCHSIHPVRTVAVCDKRWAVEYRLGDVAMHAHCTSRVWIDGHNTWACSAN